MRLISKYRDCYDFNFSHDKNDDLFIRKNEILGRKDPIVRKLIKQYSDFRGDKYPLLKNGYRFKLNKYESLEYDFLYFCGKVYILPYITKNLYTNKFIKFTKIKENLNLLFDTEKKLKEKNSFKNFDYYNSIRNLRNKELSEWHGSEFKTDLFQKLNCAYFKVNYYANYEEPITIEKYPNLGNLQFQSILQPHEIYQNVEMYVTNFLLKPEKELIKISDKDLRDSKGFDNYSFKTRKN